MRVYLTLAALLLIVVGCATRYDWQTVMSYPPQITITLESIRNTNDNCHIASFEIRNVGDMDMWFTADGSCDHPIWIVQHKMSVGWDGSTDGGVLCGNG
jgi:hypothetical protein